MRVSSVGLGIGSVLVSTTATTSSSTCCCYVKADTENCTDPYMTPSLSTMSINPGGIPSTLCCEDSNHQIIKSDWCEGSAGKKEQIDACGQNQQCIDAINELSQTLNSDNDVNDTGSISAEGNDSDATNTTSSNTTCSGESGAPDTSKYRIGTPTICKESGFCASCDYRGTGSCNCRGTCADGSIHSDFFSLCLTDEPEWLTSSCENKEPGICTMYESASEETHKVIADGIDYYFTTWKSCSGESASTMLSSSSLVYLTMLASVITIGLMGVL